MRVKILEILLLTSIVLTSCQQPQQSSTTAPAGEPAAAQPATTVEITATQSANDLTLDEIMNGTITVPQGQFVFHLINGVYDVASGDNTAHVKVLPQSTLGDLNGDGKDEAAVLLSENYGGSGVFVSLIAFQKNGDSLEQSPAILIDDRPVLNSLGIVDGKVILDAVIHGENDPMVSPSLGVVETYQLYGDALVLTGLSETISGTEQKIVLEQPMENSSVSGEVAIKGSMPVAPFENSLRYRFYDSSNNVINEGSFMVSAADIGQPATIDQSLTLPAVASGSKMRLEVAYLSAKDGSPVCMASVDLIAK